MVVSINRGTPQMVCLIYFNMENAIKIDVFLGYQKRWKPRFIFWYSDILIVFDGDPTDRLGVHGG